MVQGDARGRQVDKEWMPEEKLDVSASWTKGRPESW